MLHCPKEYSATHCCALQLGEVVAGDIKKDGERSRQEKHNQSRWINWFHVMGWRTSPCKEDLVPKVKGCCIQNQPALDGFRHNYEVESGKSRRGTSKVTRERQQRNLTTNSREKTRCHEGGDTRAPVVTAVAEHTMTRSGWIMRESAHLGVYIQTQQGHETVLLCFTDNVLLESCLWLCPRVGSKQLLI